MRFIQFVKWTFVSESFSGSVWCACSSGSSSKPGRKEGRMNRWRTRLEMLKYLENGWGQHLAYKLPLLIKTFWTYFSWLNVFSMSLSSDMSLTSSYRSLSASSKSVRLTPINLCSVLRGRYVSISSQSSTGKSGVGISEVGVLKERKESERN